MYNCSTCTSESFSRRCWLMPCRHRAEKSISRFTSLEITHERPRHVQEQLFVYTTWPETLLARRARKHQQLPRALWIDAHSLVQPCWVDWPAPERRAIHAWPAAWPAESEESEHGEWLGWDQDVAEWSSVIALLNYLVDYSDYMLYSA